MTDSPEVPPLGVLIKKALTASGLTQRKAAKVAALSESRWRQIVSGYVAVSGTKVGTDGPPATVARMARAVGVSADQLAEAGRPDAAAALRDWEASVLAAESEPLPADSQARVDERWHMLEAVLRQAPVGLSATESGTLRSRITVFFDQSPEWQPPADEAPAPSAAKG